MSKSTNRGGIALGSIFALVASLFGAVPAQAAPATDAFFITAAGADTSTFATLVDDDFTLLITRNPAVVASGDIGQLHYSITTTNRSVTTTTTYSIDVHTATATNTNAIDLNSDLVRNNVGLSVSGQLVYYNGVETGHNSSISPVTGTGLAATYAYVVDPATPDANSSHKLALRLFASDMGTWSPSVTVTVTAFLDTNGNNIFDASSEVSATQAISFKKYSEVAPSLSISSIEDGTNHATASATISGLNLDQLPGKWAVEFVQWSGSAQVTATSFSASIEQTITKAKGSSISDNITLASPARQRNTVSARIIYLTASATVIADRAADDARGSYAQWGLATTTVATTTVTSQTLYTVTGANAKPDTFRPNSTFTVRYSASRAVTGATVPVTFTFGQSGSLGSARTIAIDGGTAVTTGTASAVVKNLSSTGVAEVTITTAGFSNAEDVTVTAKAVGLPATSVTITAATPTWTATPDSELIAIAPGGTANVGVTVKDQWGQKSTLTTQRVSFTWTEGYNGGATVSYVTLTNGVAKAALPHLPATSTVSGMIDMQLQNYDAASNLWSNDSGAAMVDTEITVTNNTSGFRTGFAASYSASISYGTDLSWSAVISDVYLTVTGSEAVISGAGLIFKDVDGDTASDTITIGGVSDAQVEFYVTARKAGTYVMTATVGTATTTSLIVVNPARDNDGKSIEFDTTTIAPGKTKIVTGTVYDLNGNPVDTTLGNATIVVTYTGTAGIPVGSMPTETDADGNFKVSLLTSATDEGSFTLTAVYLKNGTSTATADKVTKVHAITVGASSDASADQKITVGTFKGYVAIYTKGYMGQKLSAKVAGKWLVVDPIAAWQGNDYSRTVRLTGAGYTIKVDLYIDGVFVRSETVVTK